jgi:hypothetical protein
MDGLFVIFPVSLAIGIAFMLLARQRGDRGDAGDETYHAGEDRDEDSDDDDDNGDDNDGW